MNDIRDLLNSVLGTLSTTGHQQAPAKERIRTVSQKVLTHLFDLLGRTREDCGVNSSTIYKSNTIHPQEGHLAVIEEENEENEGIEDEEVIQVLSSP